MRRSRPQHARSAPRGAVALIAGALLLAAGCGGPTTEPAAEPEPAPQPASVEVEVFFANETLGHPCGDVFPVTRQVDADDPVTGALQALLAGPTAAEQADGYGGWFSAATADLLLGVHVDEEGTARATFTRLPEVIPGAESTCGSFALLAQLDWTLLALDGISATRYALADQTAFYAWLQLEDPDAPDAPPPEETDQPEAGPAGNEAAAGPTVAGIVAELERELESGSLHPRDATVICDASGPAQAGDVFVCSVSSVPPEPAEWGRYVAAVLDDDTIARGLASDHPFTTAEVHEQYAAATHGLLCRDLRHGWPPTAAGQLGADAAFLWSLVYWNLEGQPARMDADGNGIPCETLYEPDLVTSALLGLSP
jgi:hypothetical protein